MKYIYFYFNYIAYYFLIISKKMSEDEAHKYLERYAMSVRINLIKAASIIVSSYLLERKYIEI